MSADGIFCLTDRGPSDGAGWPPDVQSHVCDRFGLCPLGCAIFGLTCSRLHGGLARRDHDGGHDRSDGQDRVHGLDRGFGRFGS